MVTKAEGYFAPTFKGYHGVNQVDPLSPSVFNVVVNAVIWHWVMVVVLMERVSESFRETIQ